MKGMGFYPLKKKIFICTAVLFSLMLFSGCIRHYKRPGGLSPSYSPIAGKDYEVIGNARAESSSFRLLWLIPVTKTASLKEAVEQAVNSLGGDNLIRIRWRRERQYWLVGTVDIIYVEGDVIRYIEEDEE